MDVDSGGVNDGTIGERNELQWSHVLMDVDRPTTN